MTLDGARIADRTQRVGAWLLDAVIVSLIATLIGIGTARLAGLDSWDGMTTSWPTFDLHEWIGGVITCLTWVAWQWVFLWRLGRTPGKVVLGLRVRPLDADGPLGHGMIGRRIAVGATWFASGAVPVVGFVLGFLGIGDGLTMLTDPRRQALHDRAAGTVVVASERSMPRR